MLGSGSLEIAIGIVFVYLMLSLICTSIMEAISSLMNKRGKTLFEGIKNLLNDPSFTGLAQQIYSHGLVSSISQFASDPNKQNRWPSYMPSKILSSALVDILSSTGAALNPCWNLLVNERQKALAQAQGAVAATPGNAGLIAAASEAQVALADAQAMQAAATNVINQLEQAAKTANDAKGPGDFQSLGIAAKQFAVALDAGRSLAAQCPDPLENIEAAIKQRVPDGHTKDSLLLLVMKTRQETAAVKDAAGSAARRIEAFQASVDQWYNDAMDRVTGWYKRWTQIVLVAVSLFVVVGANADTIMLAKLLMHNDALRASMAGAAVQVVEAGQSAAAKSASDAAAAGLTVVRATAAKEAGEIDLPLGWLDTNGNFSNPGTIGNWVSKILGLVITIAAVSLGAPFWFDTLSKFVNLRGAGTPPGQQNKSAPQTKLSK